MLESCKYPMIFALRKSVFSFTIPSEPKLDLSILYKDLLDPPP